MNLIFSIVIKGCFGVFLLLLVKIIFDFTENIFERYDIQFIYNQIFRVLAFGLFSVLIRAIHEEFLVV